jgi:hypothetical protein
MKHQCHVPESAPLINYGSIVRFGLAVGFSAGISAFVACTVVRSAFSMRGNDDWVAVLPALLAIIGVIDGAFYRYRRGKQCTQPPEQALSRLGSTEDLRSDALCEAGGYLVWLIFGLFAGGWIGIFVCGSFWGLLIGPAITLGIRFVLLHLFGRVPTDVSAGTERTPEGLAVKSIFFFVLAMCSLGGVFAFILRWTLVGHHSRLLLRYSPHLVVFSLAGLLFGSLSYGLWHRKRWLRPLFWATAVVSIIGVLGATLLRNLVDWSSAVSN